MIERLNMNDKYSELEISIHLNRYVVAKNYCKGKKVLDIACGEGYGSFLISKWGAKQVTGVDISKEAIEKAESLFNSENIDFIAGDATNLFQLKDNSFDLIVSFETFEHVNDVNAFLKEIKRVAKKDAVVIISCPNDYYYYPLENQKNPYHTRKYTFDEFKNISEKYLGNNVEYLLGMETMGYINTFLNGKSSENKNNKDIVNSSYLIKCYKTLNEKKISPNACNYYLGIWNAEEIVENCSVFPHMYTDWKEATDTLKNDNDELRKYNHELEISIEQFKNDISHYQKTNNDLQLLIKELTRDLERESILNKILSSQKDEVNSYASYLNEELTKLKKENFDYNDKYETLKMQMGYITNSRSYKIARKISKLVKRK